ncbi:Eukaryotic translation initiation factor 4 gamma 3 [Trichinella spiralis]|uniref:Eukaryotic translation initiation factor 4 gamma 3 n=1 Tax=Trichinella spiralis TaxID=6334 RepID=A0A0V1BKM8_TRISP|nr:Eukaryotic translation initiation factor 4 gamma 3 [Trichinella spiralis]
MKADLLLCLCKNRTVFERHIKNVHIIMAMEQSSSNVSSDDSKVSSTQQPKRFSKLLSTLRFSGVPKLTGPSDGKLLDLDDWRSPKPSLAERLFPKLFRKNAAAKESPKKIFRRSDLKKQIQESLTARRRADLQRRYEQYALDQQQRRDEHQSRKSLQPFVDVDLEESFRKEKINDEDKEQLQETENEQQEEEEGEEDDDDEDDDQGKQTEEEDCAENENAEEDDEEEIASRHKRPLKMESESEDEDEEQKCNDETDNEKVPSRPPKASVKSDNGYTEDQTTVQERITVGTDDGCKVDDQASPTCSNLLQRRNVKSLRDLSMENIFFHDDSKPNLDDTFSFVEADAAPIKAQDSFFNPDGLLSSDECKKEDELCSSSLSYSELLPSSEKLTSSGEMVLTPRSESNSTTSCTQSKLLFSESPLVSGRLNVATPKCRFDADTSLEFFCSAPFASSPIVAANYSLASGLPRRRPLPAAPSRLVFDEDAQDGFDAERMPVNFESPFQADTSKIESNEFRIEENVKQDLPDDAENCEQNIFGNQVLEELKKVKRSKFLDSRKKIRKEFLDTEAVLSSSDEEEDSGDDEVDEYEAEAGDADVVKSENELREEIGKIHLKQMLDDDRQLVEMYKEALIDSRKQRKSIRERRFAWKRNAAKDEEEGQARNADHDNSDDEENEANTTFEKWQQERLERMRLMMEMNESAEEEILFGNDTNSRIYQFGMQALRADDSQEASRKSGQVEITGFWSSIADDDGATAAHSVIFSQSMDYHSSESLLRRSQSALETAYKCSADSNSCHDFSKNIFFPITPPKDDTPRNFDTLTPSTRKRRRLLKEQGTSTTIFDGVSVPRQNRVNNCFYLFSSLKLSSVYICAVVLSISSVSGRSVVACAAFNCALISMKMSDERSNLNVSNGASDNGNGEAKSVDSTEQFVPSVGVDHRNGTMGNSFTIFRNVNDSPREFSNNSVESDLKLDSNEVEEPLPKSPADEKASVEVKSLLSSDVEGLTRPKEPDSEDERPFRLSKAQLKQLLDEPNGIYLLAHYLRSNFYEDYENGLGECNAWNKFSSLSNDLAPFQQGIVSRSGVVVAYDFTERQTSPADDSTVAPQKENGQENKPKEVTEAASTETMKIPLLRLNGMKMSIPDSSSNEWKEMEMVPILIPMQFVAGDNAEASIFISKGELTVSSNVASANGISGSRREECATAGNVSSEQGHVEQWLSKGRSTVATKRFVRMAVDDEEEEKRPGNNVGEHLENGYTKENAEQGGEEDEAPIVSRLSTGAGLNLENNLGKRQDESLEVGQLGRRLESIELFRTNEVFRKRIIGYSSTEMLEIGKLKCCFVQPQGSLILNLKAFNDIILPEKPYFRDDELENNKSTKSSSIEVAPQGQSGTSPDIVIEHRIPNAEVHLHQDSNAWVPSWKRNNAELTAEQLETQDLMNDARMILNKMTEQTFEELAVQFFGISIRCTTAERAKMLARLMFDKAVQEPGFSEIYVKLCCKICSEDFRQTSNDEQKNCPKSTRTELLNLCQSQFGSIRRVYSELRQRGEALRRVEDPSTRAELEAAFDEQSASTKRHTIGIMRLIGKLFLWRMITLTIVQQCLMNMMIEEEDIFVEHVCVLLSTMGREFELRISQQMEREPKRRFLSVDDIYEYLLAVARKDDVAVRIRFLIEELIKDREKWNSTVEAQKGEEVEDKKDDEKEDAEWEEIKQRGVVKQRRMKDNGKTQFYKRRQRR